MPRTAAAVARVEGSAGITAGRANGAESREPCDLCKDLN
jgi:hypothetical protein